jgi:hypothetical protein
MSALYISIAMGIGGILITAFLTLYGSRILNEIRGLRQSFVKFQICSEKRLSRLEVKVDKLEEDS